MKDFEDNILKEQVVIEPQVGPQTDFLLSSADVVIFGGAAGGGKSYALLLESIRNTDDPNFGAVFFRRTSPQVTNQGGLWDEAVKIYPFLGAKPNKNDLLWRFPSGSKVAFKHLQHEDTVSQWQGSQIPLIIFDELTHFMESQFIYMLSRNRSGTWNGKPYIRASCNPAAHSWVKIFLAPWLDKSYHDPAVSGEIRYFVRVNDKYIYGRTKAELVPLLGDVKLDEDVDKETLVKSVTFIRSSIFDNKKLLANDPGYLANLMSLSEVERERLLYGNWDISDGNYFSEWNEKVHVPDGTPGFEFPESWDNFLYPHKYSGPAPGWSYFGGLDYGKAAPFSFHLLASNANDQVVVINEAYEAGLLPSEQAQKILEILEFHHLSPRDVMIYADPAMFPPGDPRRRVGVYPIEAFQKAGLVCVKAVNDRIPGWTRLKEFLHEPDAFRVIKGRAPNLVRTMPLQVPDKKDPEDLDTTGEDHAEDSVRYALFSRLLKPKKQKYPETYIQRLYKGKPVHDRPLPEALR